MKIEKRGGKRENSGRKKSETETTTLSFRVPADKADAIKAAVKKLIISLS